MWHLGWFIILATILVSSICYIYYSTTGTIHWTRLKEIELLLFVNISFINYIKSKIWLILMLIKLDVVNKTDTGIFISVNTWLLCNSHSFLLFIYDYLSFKLEEFVIVFSLQILVTMTWNCTERLEPRFSAVCEFMDSR